MSATFPIAAVAALALAGTLSRRGTRNEPAMPSMAKPFAQVEPAKRTDVRGAVLYEGPSRIDGEPIIVIMTYTSSNEKTGDIPQVWLLPRGIHPHQARVEGHDARVCGGCIFAGNRGCYLNWFELKSIQDSYTRGNYSDWDHAAWWMRRNAPAVIRIGAYGDPAAAPIEVWERLAALPSGKPGPSGRASVATLIGYTQLWRSPLARGLERFCMASTKSPAEYADAKRRGWRSFRVALPEDAVCAQAQVRCPATDSDEDTCKGCRLCTGGVGGPDVMEPIHGNPRIAGKATAQMRKLKVREVKGSRARQRGVCGRCDGQGRIGAFTHYAGGVCFACSGTGELEVDPVASPTTTAKPFRVVDLPGLGRAFIERDGVGLTAVVDHGKIWFRVVDNRVVVDALSDGLREREVTVRKAREALQSVLRVRGSAAFGEAGGDGLRYKVWHQTTPAAAQAIRRQGFRIDLPRARKSDNQMPDGVFLKFSPDRIGVVADETEQILVEAEVHNPLRVRDRDHLQALLMADDDYAQRAGEYRLIDREYQKRVDDSEAETDRIYDQVYKQRLASGLASRRIQMKEDPRLEAADHRTKAIIEEWGDRIDAAAARMREAATQMLSREGHDALLMEVDRGSRGRWVKTLVVLDPQKVRPVSGSAARRVPAVTQADLDGIRDWWGRGRGAAADPELQRRIRELGARFSIAPPKALYRGLSLPRGTIGPQTTNQELAQLASGLRSWTKDKRMASAYAKRDLYRSVDEVVLTWSRPAKEHLVLDAGQLDAAARRGLGVVSSLDTSEVIGDPTGLRVESVEKITLGPNRTRFKICLT